MADKDAIKDATNVPNPLSNAKDFAHSGAIAEPEMLVAVDMDHPAIDSAPRKGLPPESYAIQMNDPTLSTREAVRRNLEAQGSDAGGPPPAKPDAAQVDPTKAPAPKA